MGDIAATVLASVRALVEGGAAGVLLQTSDRVHPNGDEADPARVAAMTVLTREAVGLAPAGFAVGVQLMRNAVSASFAVAKVAGASFVRATALVGVTATAQGWVQPDAQAIMRARERLSAWDVELIADVDTVHYSWYGSAATVPEVARRAQVAGADAVCIGTPDTDRSVDALEAVRRDAPDIEIVLAGHCTPHNAHRLLPLVDRAFVSRQFAGGEWTGTMSAERVAQFLDDVRRIV